ncbi:MAG: 23S rRNA (pseudouridine(1915)-N(3))-methyltransferase RlmH [Thermodesulfobacteriota bacterium]|nr:23S rRNA (pseudouridine(1915)-N(3))-methyltransferase RlmH [Thermodesulfobacteriota bacterium]
MKKIKFLWVGKLKKPFYQEACGHYWNALGHGYGLEETLIKDAPAKLAVPERCAWEGKKILEKLGPGDMAVVLDEREKTLSSMELSAWLKTWIEDPAKSPCFILGGAYGLSKEVLERADFSLSLGPMTFPHELARLILLEQLYRAASILKGSPYHHG